MCVCISGSLFCGAAAGFDTCLGLLKQKFPSLETGQSGMKFHDGRRTGEHGRVCWWDKEPGMLCVDSEVRILLTLDSTAQIVGRLPGGSLPWDGKGVPNCQQHQRALTLSSTDSKLVPEVRSVSLVDVSKFFPHKAFTGFSPQMALMPCSEM